MERRFCRDCIYFHEKYVQRTEKKVLIAGLCKRFPPVPHPHSDNLANVEEEISMHRGHWPWVSISDTACGEYEPVAYLDAPPLVVGPKKSRGRPKGAKDRQKRKLGGGRPKK